MFLERYVIQFDEYNLVYEFTSVGAKGKINKCIRYTQMGQPNFYNLGFGDYNKELELIDDLAVTDNGDSEKVLATVASSLYDFTEKHPNVWIFFQGSSESRTRLYKIGISKFLNEIQEDFTVLGSLGNNWETFKKNQNYSSFLIKRN
jgi:hypothetical protein